MKHVLTLRIIGVIFFIIGFIGLYLIARRRFNRRSITGLERFKSFEHALGTRALEAFASVLAKLLILVGIIVFAITFS